jgi:hypothetical protein
MPGSVLSYSLPGEIRSISPHLLRDEDAEDLRHLQYEQLRSAQAMQQVWVVKLGADCLEDPM